MLRNRIIYADDLNYMKIDKAEGNYIWDNQGEKYIDFTSGWNVANLGWNHPEINEAVKKQIDKTAYIHFWNLGDIQNKYTEQLLNALPKELCYIGRATSGTEANEEAIKTARIYTGRKKILGFNNAYHGQTLYLLSFGSLSDKARAISPEEKICIGINFPEKKEGIEDKDILNKFKLDLEEHLSKKDVAAFLAEPGMITGCGSSATAPLGFMKILREITKKYGTLIILDEVGTGFSRCGTLFGMYRENIVPDIATFAKGIANGSGALGAMATTKEIAEATHLDSVFISTFGWTSLACAAASKTLEIHTRDKVWETSEKTGNYVRNILKIELKSNPNFCCIKGLGMEIGATFKDKSYVQKVIEETRKSGLYIVSVDSENIQLMPSLIIDKDTLDKGLEIFVNSCKN